MTKKDNLAVLFPAPYYKKTTQSEVLVRSCMFFSEKNLVRDN